MEISSQFLLWSKCLLFDLKFLYWEISASNLRITGLNYLLYIARVMSLSIDLLVTVCEINI